MGLKSLNSILLVLALAATSSCGKSKEVKSNPAVTQQTVPTPGTGGRTGGRTPGDGTKTPPAAETPPSVTPVTPPKTPTRPPVQPPPPTDTKTPDQEGDYQRPKFDEAEALKTGGERIFSGKSTGLFYTGSAKDQALETAYWLGTKKTDAERSIDAQIARDITGARLMANTKNGKYSLRLNINEESEKSHGVDLVTSDDNPNILIPKSQEKKTGFLEVLSAELRCLDANATQNAIANQNCSVTLAKVLFANGQAQIIFRKNYAMVDAIFVMTPKDYETRQNTGIELWKTYIASRVEHEITKSKINSAVVSSFEVVGGKSEMGVLITTDDGIAASFRVPLLARRTGTALSSDVGVHIQIDNRFDFGIMDGHIIKSFGLSDVVEKAKVVKNNGRGDFELELTFNKKEKDVEQSKLFIIFQRNDRKVDLSRIN